MKRILPFLILVLILTLTPPGGSSASTSVIQLGSDLLFGQFHQVIEGKKVGLLTNQTGINSVGVSTIDMIRRDSSVSLTALFAPEHGLDGKTAAEASMYTHPVYGVPVYNLSGASPVITPEMLEPLDLVLVDLQEIGLRTDSSLAILHALMAASAENGKQVVVLDRPNLLKGLTDGPSMEPTFTTQPGLAGLPMAHGMTIGELALYIQRETGGELTVIPMSGYSRSMSFPDTGLPWIPPTPSFPNMNTVLGSVASEAAAGTALQFADHYSWIGGEGIDSYQLADSLNGSLLPGVVFFPENKGSAGGVELRMIEPRLFQPVKTGMYVLAHAAKLTDGHILPTNPEKAALFDRTLGTGKVRALLEKNASPQEIEASYAPQLEAFLSSREPYLIYEETNPYYPTEPVQVPRASSAGNEPPQADPESEQNVQPADGQSNAEPTPTPTAHPHEPNEPLPQEKPVPPAAEQDAPEVPMTQPPVPPSADPRPSTPASQPEKQANPSPPATKEKIAYLTFDDGPSPVTLQVLDILKAHEAKATFFVVGRNIPGNEAILQRIVAEGHTLGGHTFSHDYKTVYRNQDSFFADLEKGNALIEQATGIKPTVFRYPGGSSNTVSLKYQDPAHYNKEQTVMKAIMAESKNKGYTFIDWNVTNGDGRSNTYTAEDALSQVKQQVREQKEIVVLMHDSGVKKATAASLEEVIQFLLEKGYRFEAIQADKPTVATVK